MSSRQFLTDRIERKGDKEELHAYPLPAKEGMDDGGFEIEILLDEAPASNVFEFQIEGAEDFDVFYQPELTAEESAEGAVRPENVVGSYAVYHKTKANHRVGGTNYATGRERKSIGEGLQREPLHDLSAVGRQCRLNQRDSPAA